jgi:hypothetical protein
MSSLPAAPRRGVTPSTAYIPAADNLLCYACGAWPCITGCRLSSSSNRRTSDANGKHSNGKHATLQDDAEQEAWHQLEHKAPLKSFGDKAYSVSVFNHSIRADCVWNVVQRTIDGVTMLTPTGTVLSKIAIAFGREDFPYAWKTDIDGSDVLFGWMRVNGDTRYPIDPHKATRQADTDDVRHALPPVFLCNITRRFISCASPDYLFPAPILVSNDVLVAGAAEQRGGRLLVTHQCHVWQQQLLLQHHPLPGQRRARWATNIVKEKCHDQAASQRVSFAGALRIMHRNCNRILPIFICAPPGFTSHGIQSPALTQQSKARRIRVRMRHALCTSLFVLNQGCLAGSIRC